jgi:tellurite resistance protein TerC
MQQLIDLIVSELSTPLAGTPAWAWLLFLAIVVGLLALDLGVFHRDDRPISLKESLWTSALYVLAALAFGGWVWMSFGSDDAMRFLTGYVVEKSLSLDNVFVISLIFGFLAIPPHLQHRVLFWGILGVLIMRALLIGFGTALVHELRWLLPVFGALLIAAAIKMLLHAQDEPSIGDGRVLAQLRKRLFVTPELHGRAFFVRLPDPRDPSRTVTWVTPLFLALVLVECADAAFALESVPAILAITQEPYLVYTSNIFAVLGLRALYFALAALIARFVYLKHTLALLLLFVGGKIIYQQFGGHISPASSLGVILALLTGGILLSLWRRQAEQAPSLSTHPLSSRTEMHS